MNRVKLARGRTFYKKFIFSGNIGVTIPKTLETTKKTEKKIFDIFREVKTQGYVS